MTREEVTTLLVNNYNVRKSYLRTIEGLQNEAWENAHLKITKKGRDYQIEEPSAIKDFTKPLIIHREIVNEGPYSSYNGVPLWLCDQVHWQTFLVPTYWFYFMNKRDGDVIHFDEFHCFGFLKETDTNLEFFATDQEDIRQRLPLYSKGWGQYEVIKRLTPLKYIH